MSNITRILVSFAFIFSFSMGVASADIFLVEVHGEMTESVSGVLSPAQPGDILRFNYLVDTETLFVVDQGHAHNYDVIDGELEVAGITLDLKAGTTGSFNVINDYWVVDGIMSGANYEGGGGTAAITFEFLGVASNWFPSADMDQWGEGYWDVWTDLDYHDLHQDCRLAGALEAWSPLTIAISRQGGCCTGDLDCSGEVGFADLTALLAAWGPCAGACEADLDGSGEVGFADLTSLLAAWGPC